MCDAHFAAVFFIDIKNDAESPNVGGSWEKWSRRLNWVNFDRSCGSQLFHKHISTLVKLHDFKKWLLKIFKLARYQQSKVDMALNRNKS